ncbi:MAG: hypothetical protein ACLUKN_14315 [Bacilli bacterium]
MGCGFVVFGYCALHGMFSCSARQWNVRLKDDMEGLRKGSLRQTRYCAYRQYILLYERPNENFWDRCFRLSDTISTSLKNGL